MSDATRTKVMLALAVAPAYPSDLASVIGVSRQVMSNQLACLRGCGLVVAIPDGRRSRYELAAPLLAQVMDTLARMVVDVSPGCCSADGCTCS